MELGMQWWGEREVSEASSEAVHCNNTFLREGFDFG